MDVTALAARCSTPLGITHTYIDDESPFPTLLDDVAPSFPEHVVLLRDGDAMHWNGETWKFE